MDYRKLQNGSDIRGIAIEGIEGEHVNLTNEAVYDLARAFLTFIREKHSKKDCRISIGHDSRLSADSLCHSIMDGLIFDGAQVLDCSLASTPSMFMFCIFV